MGGTRRHTYVSCTRSFWCRCVLWGERVGFLLGWMWAQLLILCFVCLVLFSVFLFFSYRYPHEDIWPAGCFVHEGISTGTERQKVATLVFNDNFESEALCKDNGQVIGSMRCLCRPKTARYIFIFFWCFSFFLRSTEIDVSFSNPSHLMLYLSGFLDAVCL